MSASFLVTPCLVVAVQPCMEWIPIKKKKLYAILWVYKEVSKAMKYTSNFESVFEMHLYLFSIILEVNFEIYVFIVKLRSILEIDFLNLCILCSNSELYRHSLQRGPNPHILWRPPILYFMCVLCIKASSLLGSDI